MKRQLGEGMQRRRAAVIEELGLLCRPVQAEEAREPCHPPAFGPLTPLTCSP